MKRCLTVLFLLVFFLAGCESMYYDMVLDKPETGKGAQKDDSWDKAGDVSRLRSYR